MWIKTSKVLDTMHAVGIHIQNISIIRCYLSLTKDAKMNEWFDITEEVVTSVVPMQCDHRKRVK